MFERLAIGLRVAAFGTTVVLCGAAPVRAQHLPLTTYTTAQGLAGNDAAAAVEDAQGFLWIGTEHGLSRFDGKEFRTFGTAHGLPDVRVTSVVPGAKGVMWVGVWGGLYRFDFARGGVFTPIPAEGRGPHWERTVLAIDAHGQLWCGADGLYRLEESEGGEVLRRVPLPPHVSLPAVPALAVDRSGTVWAAYEHLYRRLPDGQFQQLPSDGPYPRNISFIAADDPERVWITGIDGLWTADHCASQRADQRCRLRRAAALEVLPWAGPLPKPEGGYWLGTATGLMEVDAAGRTTRRISRDQGLVAAGGVPMLLDRRGDLWIRFGDSGIQRLAADGFTSFGRQEGVEAGLITTVLITQANELVVVGHPHVFQRYDGSRFSVIRPSMPAGINGPGWGWNQVDFQDRSGQWWIPTLNGVVRLPVVRQVAALARTKAVDLLAWRGCFRGQDVFRLYEDSHSDLWIGTIEMHKPTLHRWNRATGTIDCFTSTSFLDAEMSPTAFLDDGRGTLWVGFYLGQIARYRAGRFECLLNCDGSAYGNVTAFLLDRRQRLWITTGRGGVLRLDQPASESPRVVHLTTNEGLTSNRTRALVEDRFGRIYIGNDLGVDVLDATESQIRHYGVDDGLPHAFVNVARAAANGDLWFGTLDGVARLRPTPADPESGSPRVFIDGIRVAGVSHPVTASGEQDITDLVLAPDQRNLVVDFVALPRDASRTLRFQYRLSDTEPWSPASSNRSVIIAGLAAGDHRLQIRALDAGNLPSPHVATVSLQVLAPVYRRGWFLTVAGTVFLALLALLYRARTMHLVALERQRTRIAMDLHDEMGSRLGSIGLLADLAADEAAPGTLHRARLEHIGEAASDMGSSLAEIVWSLRRGGMTLEAVAQHLAVHGRRLFAGPSPIFETHLPERWPAGEMSLAAGRAVLLIGLEALHNCARHAKASLVVLDFHSSGGDWVLAVSDDGRGIPAADDPAGGSGLGLHSMPRRAAEIGGSLIIDSKPGQGTTVRLTFNPRATERTGYRMNIREIWRSRRDIP
jgi:signal transduction histidine kinase/ligand-binding sensor domain-containing protein